MAILLISLGELVQHGGGDLVVILLAGAAASWLVLRERRRCERDVARAHERYRSILDNAPDAVVFFRENFQVSEWNAAAERLYGIGRQDAAGRVLATVPLERWNELRELLGRIDRNQPVLDYESERLRADGRRIPVALSYARMPATEGGPPVYVEIAQDIRERLQMQDKQLEMEKLTLMGRMAAGTAHHLNTPLTAMLLETEMLAARLEGGEEAGDVALIKDRIRYCQVFVRELLCFARVPELQPRPVPLCDIIRAVAHMLLPSLEVKRATFLIELEDLETERTFGDSNHFEAAFSALLSNAVDAIPAKGTIRIHGHVDAGGDGEISIDDNGPGIPPELQAFIFEPFFTTKPAGHGTGLGLPIARNILERHGGTLRLSTREGGGTRATVRVPLLRTPATVGNEETAA